MELRPPAANRSPPPLPADVIVHAVRELTCASPDRMDAQNEGARSKLLSWKESAEEPLLASMQRRAFAETEDAGLISNALWQPPMVRDQWSLTDTTRGWPLTTTGRCQCIYWDAAVGFYS